MPASSTDLKAQQIVLWGDKETLKQKQNKTLIDCFLLSCGELSYLDHTPLNTSCWEGYHEGKPWIDPGLNSGWWSCGIPRGEQHDKLYRCLSSWVKWPLPLGFIPLVAQKLYSLSHEWLSRLGRGALYTGAPAHAFCPPSRNINVVKYLWFYKATVPCTYMKQENCGLLQSEALHYLPFSLMSTN